MANKPLHVLFLCTGNSARSIIAEALLNAMGQGRFRAFSAGSQPGGTVNPHVAAYLTRNGLDVSAARSKSWDEFALAGAPPMDFIVTVCDSAAGEACPIWPGKPISAHWGVSDPAHIEDPVARERAIAEAFRVLRHRISRLVSLPLDRLATQAEMRQIGQSS